MLIEDEKKTLPRSSLYQEHFARVPKVHALKLVEDTAGRDPHQMVGPALRLMLANLSQGDKQLQAVLLFREESGMDCLERTFLDTLKHTSSKNMP